MKNKIIRIVTVFLMPVAVGVWTSAAYADTHVAASCQQADVQAAIDAASDGDTVSVPAGTATWTTPVTFSNKGIILTGAGIDNTIITDNTTTDWDQTLIWVTGAAGKPFRITGFTFNNSNAPAAIQIRGDAKDWRIDHIKFDGHSNLGVSVGSCGTPETFGVIDHCTFTAPTTQAGIAIHTNAAVWNDSLRLGTADAVYVEDCVFDYDTFQDGRVALDGYEGARYVFRYNTLRNQGTGHHDACSGCPPLPRATFSFEIYHNTITLTNSGVFGIRLRGGTGVVFNNAVSGPVQQVLSLTNYRSCAGAGVSCGNYDRCDGDSLYDGNLDATGYPALDQIGRTADSNSDGIQDLEPLYEWNNTYNSTDVDFNVQELGCSNPSVSDHIKENRDYYNDTPKSGYTPYTYPHPVTQIDVNAFILWTR